MYTTKQLKIIAAWIEEAADSVSIQLQGYYAPETQTQYEDLCEILEETKRLIAERERGRRLRISAWGDGSCDTRDKIGGWGVVLKTTEGAAHEKTLNGALADTTSNRCEMLAVLEAVKALRVPTYLTFWTDSQVVYSYLINDCSRDKELLKIAVQIGEALSHAGHKLDLKLVNGRAGNSVERTQHKRAHQLANKARRAYQAKE